jgi:iron complex outermembrane receptor protein
MRKSAANCNSGSARLRIRPVAAACATLLVATSSAYGQQQNSTNLNAVTVTGIRASIESSIAVKKGSDSIVEAVSAEDIGKLPDTSIAESLARLPGLTAQRVDGRAQVISIRGLSPNYAGALLNGREMVSSSDSRAAEYDQFPSELINSAVVYKTPDASLIGQGLSGTIDVKTLMPLDVRGRKVSVNVRGERNSNGTLTEGASGTGNRFSVSYVDQFADNTLGVSLGYAHLNSPGQTKQYKAWESGDYTQWGVAPFVGVPKTATGYAAVAQGFDANVTSSSQIRDGLMAVVEYRPNQDFHSVLDLYYSNFKQDRTGRTLLGQAGPWNGTPPNPEYSNVATSNIEGNTVVTSGSMTDVVSLIRGDKLTRSDDLSAIGWKNTFKLANKWTAMADINYSRAVRNEDYVELYASPVQTGVYNFSGLGVSGNQSYSTSQNLTDPSTVLLRDPSNWGVIRSPRITDEIRAFRLVGKHDMDGFFSGVESGVNYAERNKEVNRTQFNLSLAGGASSMPVPANALRSPTDLSGSGFNGSIMSFDVPSVFGLYSQKVASPWEEKDNHYGMHEKVTTVYGKLNIDSELGAVPVRGNVGVQWVHTDQFSNGFAWVNDKIYPVGDGTNYNDVLPSLNLVFSLQPDLIGRFGWAKTMARPRMDDLRAGADQPKVGDQPGTPGYGLWSASGGGNPKLEPWRAKSFDLSLEKYLNKRSYVAGAAFYKDLETFIYNQSVIRDFSSFNNTILPGGVQPTSPFGTVSAPANGTGGVVSGVEISASLDGSLFTQALDGFGVTASWSSTRSSLHEANNPDRSLDGLSGIVNTVGMYYEKNGFSSRISQRYRSAYEATTRGVLLNNVTSRIAAETTVDLQLGYAFESGAYKGLSMLLQVNNLTDTPYSTSQSLQVGADNKVGVLPMTYATYGRTMLVGATYKF